MKQTFRLVCRRLTVYVGHAFITIKKLICLFSKAIVKMLKEKIDLLRYQQEMSENPLHYACIFLNFTKALVSKGKETWKTTTCTYKEKTYPVDEMGQQSFTDITIINCALNVPLMIISIWANSLVLAAMLTAPSLRSPSTVFLCCLTISDILVGFIAQPVYIATELERAPLLYGPMFALTSLACGVSVLTMAVISVDRYLALRYHMTYPHMMTEKRALYITLTVWLTGAFVSCIKLWNTSFFFYVTAVGIGVCITISTFSYVKNFSDRSSASTTNSSPTSGGTEPKYCKPYSASKKKCHKHFYILHVYDSVLFSTIRFHVDFSCLSKTRNRGMEFCRYDFFYELVYKSSLVLLAS